MPKGSFFFPTERPVVGMGHHGTIGFIGDLRRVRIRLDRQLRVAASRHCQRRIGERSPVGAGHQALNTAVQLQNNPYSATSTTITANAPTLKTGLVLKVCFEMAMPFASSAPWPSLQLTAAMTAMVSKVV